MSVSAAIKTPSAPPPLPQAAEDLARAATLAGPATTNAEVMALFAQAPELNAIVVVDQERPIGLINRNAFFDRFARPFHRDIFLRRPCTVFMDPSPVLVDAGVPLNQVGAVVAQGGEKGLNNGFLITSGGKFYGHCDGLTLLRALSDLQEDQHRQLLSSIEYAQGIQQALLAESRAVLERRFGAGHAVDWQPRDLVGGDCFFAADDEEGVLVGLIDCTGHGVPGALLTSIALSELNRLTADPALRRHPARLIQGLNQRVKAALQQAEDVDGDADEGMDAAFVWIPHRPSQALAASAKLPITVMGAAGEVQVFKGDRRGVGYRSTSVDFAWSEQVLPMGEGLRLVLATDGVCDQIGEERAMAFGWTRFRQALAGAAAGPTERMVARAREALKGWQAGEARRDDVTVLAIDLKGAAL
jgi:serine phosphatase RsbU (regulator of sigma subunit)